MDLPAADLLNFFAECFRLPYAAPSLLARRGRFDIRVWCTLRSLQAWTIDNQAVASLPGEISPYPLQEDSQTQAGSCEELQMHASPRKPGGESADLDFAALQYS